MAAVFLQSSYMKIYRARMNGRLKLLWYEIKVASPAAGWVLLLLMLAGLVFGLDVQADASRRYEYSAILAEIIFPLGMTFVANSLILREREENTLPFVAARSPLTVLWLRRLGSWFIAGMLGLLVILLVYHQFYFRLAVGQMMAASLAVSLALTGASCAASFLFKEMNAGFLLGTLWWAFCLISAKAAFAVSGPYLYLFYFWFDARHGLEPGDWIYNKLALSLVGVILISTSLLMLRARERFLA